MTPTSSDKVSLSQVFYNETVFGAKQGALLSTFLTFSAYAFRPTNEEIEYTQAFVVIAFFSLITISGATIAAVHALGKNVFEQR